MKTLPIIGALALLSTSCNHIGSVTPRENGIHDVNLNGYSEDGVKSDALEQAENYCELKEKNYVVLEDKVSYQDGALEESDYKIARVATNSSFALGPILYVAGGPAVQVVGGSLYLAAFAGNSYIGAPYRMDMKFKCK